MFSKTIDVRIEATKQSVQVKSNAANYLQELPNSLLIDEAAKKLYGIGRTEDALRSESPDVWAKRPASMCCKPIYDPANFDPLLTYSALHFFSRMIYHDARPLLFRLWLARFDLFTYHLILPDYDSIPLPSRKQFERMIFTNPKNHIQRLMINGISYHQP